MTDFEKSSQRNVLTQEISHLSKSCKCHLHSCSLMPWQSVAGQPSLELCHKNIHNQKRLFTISWEYSNTVQELRASLAFLLSYAMAAVRSLSALELAQLRRAMPHRDFWRRWVPPRPHHDGVPNNSY